MVEGSEGSREAILERFDAQVNILDRPKLGLIFKGSPKPEVIYHVTRKSFARLDVSGDETS